MTHSHDDHFDGDFRSDMHRILSRRRLLTLGAAGLAMAPGGAMAQALTCIAAPAETGGPFPADGSATRGGGSLNVLDQAGIVRSDLRPSFAGLDGVADGQAMDLTLTLQDVDTGCAPVSGFAVYAWHCDAAGRYSLYEVEDRNYLRGMQVSDEEGRLTFRSILPGTYRGRWPHIHFEVFRSVQEAASGARPHLTGQLAFAEDLVRARYDGDPRYADSIPNLDGITLARDGIFRDSTPAELAAQTVTATRDDADLLAVEASIGLTAL